MDPVMANIGFQGRDGQLHTPPAVSRPRERAEWMPSLPQTPHSMIKYSVSCGNGHAPFIRLFDTEGEAKVNALTHNYLVHNDACGDDLATISKTFINLPV